MLLLILASSVPAMAQNCDSAPNDGFGANYPSYAAWCSGCGGFPSSSNGVSCTRGPNWGKTGSNSPAANSALYNGLYQSSYQLGYALGRWLFGGSSNPQAEAQQEALKQQMMLELQRRQAEAERLHQEEEARRIAAMYNRLYATLKLSGLPDLHLKGMDSNGPGLKLKLGDSTDGQAGIKGLPGIYLNDGKTPYGIPGLPGIYTGGPGQGSGLTNSKLALKMGDGSTGAAPGANAGPVPAGPSGGEQPSGARAATSGPATALANESGLQLKTGDSNTAPAAQATTIDPSKMTPQQLADVAEMVSKLPPEEQQRLLAAAQKDAAAGQPIPTQPLAQVTAASPPGSSPAMLPQTAAPPVASLQQQANASQAAAATSTPEEASAKARGGFDTPLGPRGIQPVTATASSQSPSAPPQAPASAATVNRERTADSVASPGITAPPAATSPAGVRPSPSAELANLSTPAPGGRRYVESVGECLSRYTQTGSTGSAPSLEELQKKLEFERGALEKLLETQNRENEERNEWLKEMRKAAQDVALHAIDKGVEGLFDSSKEALQEAEVELHGEIEDTTKEARELQQEMAEARKAIGTAKDDPARLASFQAQWADADKYQIQPLLKKRKALEDQWESIFNLETRVEHITVARDFGAWLTDMDLPCDYENDHVTCRNFKENNAISQVAAGDYYNTGLDGFKLALDYAAHHAAPLKKLSSFAVMGTTVGEVWDTTSLLIDLSYDTTVGILGYQRLQQVKQNDPQFEKAKSILGARIDRMNAEVSCYQNAN